MLTICFSTIIRGDFFGTQRERGEVEDQEKRGGKVCLYKQ